MDELGIRGVTGTCDRNGRVEGPAIGVSGGSGAKRGSSRTYIHCQQERERSRLPQDSPQHLPDSSQTSRDHVVQLSSRAYPDPLGSECRRRGRAQRLQMVGLRELCPCPVRARGV